MAAHPDFVFSKNPGQMAPEERQQWMRLLVEAMTEMETWYDNGIQSDTVAEIRALLDRGVAG